MDEWLRTCTIITGEPNELVAEVHTRMPVILPEEHHAKWLGEAQDGAEVRPYFEKEHPDWLRALTRPHINAPADYWHQKVLTVSSLNAAMQNYVSIYEHQTRPNPALAAVHGQAALLLRYDVPTYYVSRELLAAALRTEVPDDMVFEAIPFPFDVPCPWFPEAAEMAAANGALDVGVHMPFLATS